MEWNLMFFLNSILLGVGLSMDAFSMSVASALAEPDMPRYQMNGRAGVFAFFQFAMPMIGWICVHTIVHTFRAFEAFIPWIALILLLYIGGKMFLEGWHHRDGDGGEESHGRTGVVTLLLQGVATSIDALSVGFTIADYTAAMAFVCALIIAVVTFALCRAGFAIGKTVGSCISGRAEMLGGAILIFIGVEIFIKGVFF